MKRRHEWLRKEPGDWPASARTAFDILARAALRRMEQERAQASTERKRTETEPD